MRPARHRPAMLLLLLPALAAGARSLSAQESGDSWRTQLELGFNGSSGNSSFSVLRTGGSLTYLHTDVAEFEFSTLLRYGKNDSKVISNDIRGTLKFDWKPKSAFSPFAFVTASRDEIRKLDAKVNGGIGAKWSVIQSGAFKASLSAAGILDYENYAIAPGSNERPSEGTYRISGRVKIDHQFASGAKFQHVTFWQPEVTNFADFNLQMTNSLSTQLLSKLALGLEHEFLHDAVPPPGVKQNDQKFSAVLRVIL